MAQGAIVSARTPGPKDILGNVIAHDCITFRLQGRDIPLQMLQSARDEAENYREKTITLTAQVAALRKALTRMVNAYQDEITRANNDVPLTSAALYQARSALAKDGAE